MIDNGEKSIYLKILKDIKLRDKADKNRKNSPLVVPKGAKIINNSHTFKKTIAQIKNTTENLEKHVAKSGSCRPLVQYVRCQLRNP